MNKSLMETVPVNSIAYSISNINPFKLFSILVCKTLSEFLTNCSFTSEFAS